MDDWDGLHICETCGDAYTTGRLCRSCAEQEMIDNAEPPPPFDEDIEDDDDLHGDWCPACNGTGHDKWEPWLDCDYCMGEGYVWW